jgi:hypothetical protein
MLLSPEGDLAGAMNREVGWRTDLRQDHNAGAPIQRSIPRRNQTQPRVNYRGNRSFPDTLGPDRAASSSPASYRVAFQTPNNSRYMRSPSGAAVGGRKINSELLGRMNAGRPTFTI